MSSVWVSIPGAVYVDADYAEAWGPVERIG